jgi:hypothetical protein
MQNRADGKNRLCVPACIILDSKEVMKETTTLLSNEGWKDDV